ncbi:MAG: small multi-drug export protein [Deltaproteobacteria bacterium]|nr:small multi-drug export protein [Deltaproteobacteria bacterium]
MEPLSPTDSVHPYDATWRERVVVLGLVYGALVLLFALGMSFARGATLELLGLLPATFFVAGKFLPLWAASGKSNFGPYELGAVVWLLDTIWVLNIVYLLEVFYKVGPIRRGLMKVQGNARLVLRAYPRVKRAATIGVVAFVLFPVAGTGAIGGSFIGIFLGMSRQGLIAAVSFGGFLGGMAMAFAAVHFEGAVRSLRAAQASPAIKYAVIGGVVAVLAWFVWWLNRKYQAALAQAEAEERGS